MVRHLADKPDLVSTTGGDQSIAHPTAVLHILPLMGRYRYETAHVTGTDNHRPIERNRHFGKRTLSQPAQRKRLNPADPVRTVLTFRGRRNQRDRRDPEFVIRNTGGELKFRTRACLIVKSTNGLNITARLFAAQHPNTRYCQIGNITGRLGGLGLRSCNRFWRPHHIGHRVRILWVPIRSLKVSNLIFRRNGHAPDMPPG